MKLRDLTDADIGKQYLWPEQQPEPVPFRYLGRLEGEVEPSWLIQLEGQPPSSLLCSVWSETDLLIVGVACEVAGDEPQEKRVP